VGKRSLVVLGEYDGVITVEATTRELGRCGWAGRIEVVKDVGHLVV
jgi:hypothetical protein